MAGDGQRSDPLKRFSNRVENYVRYRPKYPERIMSFLKNELGLTPSSVVAEVGSGTGIFTELLLKNGNVVHAIEPNEDMREAAERLLAKYDNFKSIDATGEATTLADGSADFIFAAQTFHWLERTRAKKEFARIVRDGARVVLIWNVRRIGHSAFSNAYEDLIQQYGIDYQNVRHSSVSDEDVKEFYSPFEVKLKLFDNFQIFNFEGLKGRLLSSSYIPLEGDDKFDEMVEDLHKIFKKHAMEGQVSFEYDTKVYYGRFGG